MRNYYVCPALGVKVGKYFIEGKRSDFGAFDG
jgi:hypothetical protein